MRYFLLSLRVKSFKSFVGGSGLNRKHSSLVAKGFSVHSTRCEEQCGSETPDVEDEKP